MKTNKVKPAVGYIRSATKDDLSVKEQEKSIRKCCADNSYKLADIFVDNGCSGANLNRPALQGLLVEASAGRISKVICLDRSRLSRSTADYLALTSLFKKHEVEAIFISDISANEDSYSQSIDELLAVFNSLHSQISKRKCCCDCSCDCRNR